MALDLRFKEFIDENASNTGIGHLGKHGKAGASAACGHRRAHITLSASSFEGHDNKCVKCEAKHNKMKQISAKHAERNS